MWKKDELPETSFNPSESEERLPPGEPPRARESDRNPAAIGRSITIRGEVSGDEDLLIHGRVEGSVDLKQHSVTVGPDGQVKAGITARVVTVEGRVEGDLHAEEQVVLRSSAWVEGDIMSPRVVLDDGARFRGGVDMGDSDAASQKASASAPSSASSKPASQSPKKSAEVLKMPADPSSKESAKTADDRTKGATEATA